MTPDMAPRKSRLRALLDNMETALLQVDAGLRLVYLNPAAEALLERSAARVLGRPVQQLCRPQSEVVCLMREVLRSGRTFTRREYELPLPSGRSEYVNLTVGPLPPEGVLVEVQRLGRHHNIVQDARRQRELDATRNLIRGLAHEVKNPLGGIRGAAQLLEAELADAEQREYTQVIIKEADRLHKLIDRMLGPRRPLQRAPVNLHEVTERVIRLLQAEASDDVRIVRDYDPSIPELSGDVDQLIQAVLNVARNAYEALRPGGGTITFRTRVQRHYTIGTRRHTTVAQLTIHDDGPGIPEALQPQIFFPMVSDKNTGSGIGLPIAQALISAHDGLLKFQSRPGDTTFEFILPFGTAHD